VILLALAGMGVNYFLLAFAPSLWLFAVGRMIAGAFGATFTAAGAYLADITPPEKRAQSFGLICAAFGFGFITGPALGGVLGGVDLRLPFLVAGFLSLADFAFAYFALPESLAEQNRKPLNLKYANPIEQGLLQGPSIPAIGAAATRPTSRGGRSARGRDRCSPSVASRAA
jgi:MFS transporter, DHA1 family, tetracycline resistance protein